EVHRDVLALRDRPPGRVGEGTREIARLAQDRRAGGAHQVELHLFRDSDRPLPDHLELRGPQRHARSSQTFPSSSVLAVWPGQTTTVDSGSTSRAGPATCSTEPRRRTGPNTVSPTCVSPAALGGGAAA